MFLCHTNISDIDISSYKNVLSLLFKACTRTHIHICTNAAISYYSLIFRLPVEAESTSFSSCSQRVRFGMASDCSRLSMVSCVSEISLPSISVSSMPNSVPSRPLSVMFTHDLPSRPSPASDRACSLISFASRFTS